MINYAQLRDLIIKPALYDLMLLDNDAIELLIFTCAVESLGGSYLKQVDGPALGIYQMEPKTYNDIWQNYLKNEHSLMLRFISNFQVVNIPAEERLIYDLRFATAMTRIHYKRVSAPLPKSDNLPAIWDYYKEHYNSSLGAAQKDEAIAKYHSFIKV